MLVHAFEFPVNSRKRLALDRDVFDTFVTCAVLAFDVTGTDTGGKNGKQSP